MNALTEFVGRWLTWCKSSRFHHVYELRAGAEVLARLRWSKIVGSLALAEAGGNAWTLKRTGFLKPQVTLRKKDAQANLAVFTPDWHGTGQVAFVDGHKYEWARRESSDGEWVFSNPFGEELIQVRVATPPLQQADELSDAHATHLVLLGWYLLVLQAEEQNIMTGAV
jgi:hypothetical protein